MATPSTPQKVISAVFQSTPFLHKVSSVHMNRYRSQLDPLVDKELEGNILPTLHDTFLEHALGVPPDLAAEWSPAMSELHEHQLVKDCLKDLSTAKDEPARYAPFAKMANYVLDEMQKKYPLPATAIPDLRFVRNDPTIIKGPVGALTPPRKPDIVLVRKEVADRLAETGTPSLVSWTDILCAFEFKVDSKKVKAGGGSAASRGAGSGAASASRKATETTKSHPNTASGSRMARSRAASASRKAKGTANSHTNSASASRGIGSGAVSTSRIVKETAKSYSHSASASTSHIPSGLGSGGKRKREEADVPADEPSSKRSDSRRRTTGSVHTGGSGVTHKDFSQLSSYPLEMLSSTRGTREHAFSIFVDGDEMQLWFYDRAGAIHTDSRINFRTDFVAFATIVLACARLDLHHFGFLSAVKFPSAQVVPASLEGATITLRDEQKKEHTVTFTGDIISSRPGLVGRCSFVCGAICPTISNASGLVVKLSFQDVKRLSEVDVIKHARDSGVPYLPTVYLSQDFARLSRGIRKSLIPIEGETLNYQDRVLRVMVSQRYTPVYKLPSLPDFRRVIRNVFECLNRLRRDANVLHRDISYTNIMAERLADGSFQGILNDFDLAIRLDNLSAEGHASLHRTGTLPFMAMELLTDDAVTHTFQHDVESLFYVLVWIAAHYDHEGKDIHQAALSDWQDGSLDQIRRTKREFIIVSSALRKLNLTDFYAELRTTWLKPLHYIVFRLHMVLAQLDRQPGPSDSTVPTTDDQLYDDVLAVLQTD